MLVSLATVFACYAALVQCSPVTEPRLAEPQGQTSLRDHGRTWSSKLAGDGGSMVAQIPKLSRRAPNQGRPTLEDMPASITSSVRYLVGEAAGKCICKKVGNVRVVEDHVMRAAFPRSVPPQPCCEQMSC